MKIWQPLRYGAASKPSCGAKVSSTVCLAFGTVKGQALTALVMYFVMQIWRARVPKAVFSLRWAMITRVKAQLFCIKANGL